ncbi:MAG: CinA family nicotinamide mononucleotide deamidase-related protein [Anaerolineales bacterium]|nr:CinA family nicotinamide mononucleotide deamidase-related protein [Anaerolineales bacterium]
MPNAEILTIGTEILLGEIVDTNSRFISRLLRDHNVDIYWLSTVGDNPNRIAEAIRLGLERSEIIVTTGGLGPTIDDPTREAAALALGVETEFRPELWQQVQDRFARFGRTPTENNRRQAYVPAGAIAIENPVGTAPAFIGETEKNALICLPGVPREMEYLMTHAVIPYLKNRFDLRGMIKTRILRTAGAGESLIDEKISDLETLSNPTVGLSAHAGSVDIRITAKASSGVEADALIAPVEADLRERLGNWIYGTDSDSLESVALAHLEEIGWTLAVVEAGLSGKLTQKLANTSHPTFLGGEVLAESPNPAQLMSACRQFRDARHADLCIGIALQRGEEKQNLHLTILSPIKERTISRSYGGPPKMSGQWAVNNGLDLIRRLEGE